MGCVFIGVGALLVRSLGVLVTGLGMIAGQLLGSLGLDLVFPAPGTVVALPTVLGTMLTLAAIILATLPWPGARSSGTRSRAGRLGGAASCTAITCVSLRPVLRLSAPSGNQPGFRG